MKHRSHFPDFQGLVHGMVDFGFGRTAFVSTNSSFWNQTCQTMFPSIPTTREKLSGMVQEEMMKTVEKHDIITSSFIDSPSVKLHPGMSILPPNRKKEKKKKIELNYNSSILSSYGSGVQVFVVPGLSLPTMGKSPGKWIKTVLFGKKASKSNFSKGREKVAKEKEVWVAAKAPETDLASNSLVASHLAPDTIDKNEGKLELESREATSSLHDEGISLLGNENTETQGSTQLGVPNDPERIRQEQAVTMAQAAFRGYMARRAFRALKGIIRLQALVRGHLVRRQAVSTLRCMLGIVKLQALVRGRRVRQSDIGLEVHKQCILVKNPDGKLVDPVGVNLSTQLAKLSANAFVCKLLASSATAMPLRIRYDSGEPNAVLNWLEYWSASRFWKPVPQSKKAPNSKSQKKQGSSQIVETETGRPRRSVRRVPAANVDNVSLQSTSELEKPKCNFRKVSSHPVEPVQENPQIELEKVKRNLRKVHNPIIDNSVRPEVETEKPKQSPEKVLSTSGHDVLEQSMTDSAEKMKKETTVTMPKLPDVETTPELLTVNEPIDLSRGNQAAVEVEPLESSVKDENIPVTNGELISKEDSNRNENPKSGRKASIPAKQERAENGLQYSPTLPSYMAATESAKAKLRAQGSPRFSQDGADKNNLTRRHSLPSSTGSKISSQSPRTQRLVQAGGKGGNRSEKSLVSSRDGNGKVVQAEWRR